MANAIRHLLHIFIAILFGFSASRALAADDSSSQVQTAEFPRLIPFYDYLQLPRAQQETYLLGLRQLLEDLAHINEHRPAEFVAQRHGNDDAAERLLDQAKLVLLLSQTFVSPAHAADAMSLQGKTCEGGAGTNEICAWNAFHSQQSCFCGLSNQAIAKAYCGSGNCDWKKDDQAVLDVQKNFEQRWIGGEQKWVTKDSINKVKQTVGADMYSSIDRYTGDAQRSRVFSKADTRDIDTSRNLDQLAKDGETVNPISGVKTDHVFNAPGAAQDARIYAQDALEKSRAAKTFSPLTASKNSDVAASARDEVSADTKATTDSAEKAKASSREATDAARDKIIAAEERPAKTDLESTMQAAEEGLHAGSSAGIAGAKTEEAARNLKAAADNMSKSKDPKVQGLKAEVAQAADKVNRDGKSMRKDGADLLKEDSKMVADKAKELDGAAKGQMNKLAEDLKKQGDNVAKKDVDAIEKGEDKTLDQSETARKAANLPPSDPRKTSDITCLKTGQFTCPDLKNRKKSQAQYESMRAAYVATEGEKRCIFGGNSSVFDTNAKSRGGKQRPGCTAVSSSEVDIGGQATKLECPKGDSNQKLVLCSPLLFGFDRDGSGKAVGRCVDWNSRVTSSCNFKYPLPRAAKKAGAGTGTAAGADASKSVSATDYLRDPKNKLEPEWQKLSDTINKHCNSKEFRSLNCEECSIIGQRLSRMKARATAGSCTWPSELKKVRDDMGKSDAVK